MPPMVGTVISRLGGALLMLGLGAACSGASPEIVDASGSDSDHASGTEAGDSTSSNAGSTGAQETTEGPPPEVAWPTLDCDPLVSSVCGYPFPNNVFTVPDSSTPTGRRVELGPSFAPSSKDGVAASPAAWSSLDGFSISGAMVAHLPGAASQGLVGPLEIERSILPESPTVLLDADTGAPVPHFAEFDLSHSDSTRRALLIRPAVPLARGTRYIVGIHGLLDASAATWTPEGAFAALRDGIPSTEPSIEERRGLYEDIFQRLEAAGVDRAELQLAWDFTTASEDNITGRMLSMRDKAFELVGSAGPEYVIQDTIESFSSRIALKITGTMSVPLYLDDPGPGGAMELDAEGRPRQNGFAEYPFEVLVPNSATQNPAPVLFVGHGLLGEHTQVEAKNYQQFADEHGYVLIATDWSGMANDDVLHMLTLISEGRIHDFSTVTDRLHQGVLNAALAVRMATGRLASDPALQFGGQSAIDPSTAHYVGSSQGGIFGSTLMAISPDLKRGILDVPGQPYNLLLNRSVDFTPYVNLLFATYDSPLDIQTLLILAQMLWDRVEPSGYSHHLVSDPLPGTPAKEVLLQVAIGDHQVSSLGAHIMARAIGAPNLGPANREIWGVPTMTGPLQGAALIEYDFGLAAEPVENIPPSDGEDPHGLPRQLPESVATRAEFLATGMIRNTCDGACDPE